MSTPDPVARRFAELRSRVQEQLQPGETFVAAVWVSRATNRPSAREIARKELNARRLLEGVAAEAVGIDDPGTGPETYTGSRRGILEGDPSSLAAQLDQQVPTPTEPRVLAITSHRVVALAKAAGEQRPRSRLAAMAKGIGDIVRNQPNAEPLPPLVPLWECPRPALAAASEQAGRMRVSFSDGSALVVVTPAALAPPFIAAATRG